MKMSLKAAAVMAFVLPISAATARGQMTGVSHPDEVPITTSPEGISQPIVYTPTPVVTAKELKPRAIPGAEPTREEAAPVLRASVVEPEVAPSERLPANTEEFKLGVAPRNSLDGQVITRVAGPSNQLPIGTFLKVRMTKELTTKSTHAGAEFTADLAEAVERDGRVLLPAGSVLSGHVSEVHGGRRISGAASIHLQPTSVTLPDGTSYLIRGQVIDSDLFRSTKVDGEGTIIRKDHGMKTAATIGLAAGSGAAAGAIFGGWPGAIIGAGIGGGVGAVVWLKQDRQTDLPVETKVVFALTAPVVIGR